MICWFPKILQHIISQTASIKDRIAERKAQAAVDDESSALNAEKMRRMAGKEAQKAHEEYQKKQAELEMLQKKRVRALIPSSLTVVEHIVLFLADVDCSKKN